MSGSKPPRDADERREWEPELELELAIARDHAPQCDHEQHIAGRTGRIFPCGSFAIDEKALPSAAVFDLVKRAATELERRALARLHDDHK